MPYKPIEEYGMIGDLETVALIATDGGIDCPVPDSPTVFGAILDDARGGRFSITPKRGDRLRQMFPDTNVRPGADDGVGDVTDFMPVLRHAHAIVRGLDLRPRAAADLPGALRAALRLRAAPSTAPRVARAELCSVCREPTAWCCGCARRRRSRSRMVPPSPS